MNTSLPPGAEAPPPRTVKQLWTAVGVLGVSVLALGGTLAAQQMRGPAAPVAVQTQNALAAPAAPRTPESEIIEEKAPQVLTDKGPAAPISGAQEAPRSLALAPAAPAAPARPTPRPQPVMQHASDPYLQPAVQPRPAAPAVCGSCGQVESVQAISQPAPATGVGMVAGGVLGGVLGNQIGKGSGRKVATVLGAVGGGYVGHQVEQRARSTTTYRMRVRMHDGSVRTFTRAQPVAEGTPVRATSNGFRIDSNAGSASAPPATMRVVDSRY